MGDRVRLTVGIATRNRLDSLIRCLRSLELLGDTLAEAIVVDDSSDEPVTMSALPSSLAGRTRVLRQHASEGYIVARNTIMRLAATEHVMLMDDDAFLLEAAGVKEALEIMDRDGRIGAIGFAQAESDGRPWPGAMQPAPVSYRCRVASFIGFAHLLRRRIFDEVGCYREALGFYGEEKDFCARLLRAGYHVIYLPDVLVAHVPDPAGRSNARYLRYVVRNDCLFALYNLPWLVACVETPRRLMRYFPMKRMHPVRDPAGFLWIVTQILGSLPRVARERRPVRWATLKRWRELRQTLPAYERAAAHS